MYCFPFFCGKIATEYDESYSLLQMVGNLMKRMSALESALHDATSIINMLSSKIDNLDLDVKYLDNSANITIDIYHNNQYILTNTVEKITLTARHYIHDCNCDECVCDGILSKDGFICEIACRFENKQLITDIISSVDFELAWCNDASVEGTTNATVCIWWDGSRFCAAVGKYAE
jgi:hypothetical protein